MSRIREYAKGQQCQVRLEGVCNFNPETVVLAHINGAGMGVKALDFHGAYCCSACHVVVDGAKSSHSRESVLIAFYEGVIRTQSLLYFGGLLIIQGEKNARRKK